MTVRSRREFLRFGVGAGLAALAAPRPAFATAASTAQRAAILARALSYEQTLADRAGKTVDLLLIHDASSGTRSEALEWWTAFEALSGVRVDGRPLRAQIATLNDDLPEIFSRGVVDVAIACGDVSDDLVSTVSTLTRGTRTLSVATRRKQVEDGLTLGVIKESEKVRILVNLRAAEREGVRFSAKLLKLAEILR